MGCISGEWDETEFNLFVLNDTGYNIMTMSKFLRLNVTEGQKEERRMVNWEVVKFKYPKNVEDHYRYGGQ